MHTVCSIYDAICWRASNMLLVVLLGLCALFEAHCAPNVPNVPGNGNTA